MNERRPGAPETFREELTSILYWVGIVLAVVGTVLAVVLAVALLVG